MHEDRQYRDREGYWWTFDRDNHIWIGPRTHCEAPTHVGYGHTWCTVGNAFHDRLVAADRISATCIGGPGGGWFYVSAERPRFYRLRQDPLGASLRGFFLDP